MSDIEAIRKRNEERQHHGECSGWSGEGWTFTEADCNCDQIGVKADIDALLAEVERLNREVASLRRAADGDCREIQSLLDKVKRLSNAMEHCPICMCIHGDKTIDCPDCFVPYTESQI